MRMIHWVALLMVASISLSGCAQDNRCATYGMSQSSEFFHVGNGSSGTIDASYDSESENKTWNCCNDSVYFGDSGSGPVHGTSMIVGYLFGIELEDEYDSAPRDNGLNVTLHEANYSSDEIQEQPQVEVSGECFLGELTWKTQTGMFTHNGTLYWGLAIEENVIDFDDGGDAAVLFEANATVEVFVIMKKTSYFA